MKSSTAGVILRSGLSEKSHQMMMLEFKKRSFDAIMKDWKITATMKEREGGVMIKYEKHNCKTVWVGGRPAVPDYEPQVKVKPVEHPGPTVPALPGKQFRLCELCGRAFGKAPATSQAVFEGRKYCSNTCHSASHQLRLKERAAALRPLLPSTLQALSKQLSLSQAQVKSLLDLLLEQCEIETDTFKDRKRVYRLTPYGTTLLTETKGRENDTTE